MKWLHAVDPKASIVGSGIHGDSLDSLNSPDKIGLLNKLKATFGEHGHALHVEDFCWP
jgi:hypothetical protein